MKKLTMYLSFFPCLVLRFWLPNYCLLSCPCPCSVFFFFYSKDVVQGKEPWTGTFSLGFKFVWSLLTGSVDFTVQYTYQWFFSWPPCLSHLHSCPKVCFKTCSICSHPTVLSAWAQGLAVNPSLFFHLPSKYGFAH